MKNTEVLRVAFIGFGPRAMGALEALIAQIPNQELFIDIFEPNSDVGAGPNFSPAQSDLGLLNIPTRNLDYAPPAIIEGRIAPYCEWAADRYGEEDFPPRSHFGKYLVQRFKTLVEALPGHVNFRHFPLKATAVSGARHEWYVECKHEKFGPFQEILLSPGQPKTSVDEQIKRWMSHAKTQRATLLHAYPLKNLIDAAQSWKNQTVGIRGLGLSTFDVLRALTIGLGGSFRANEYVPSGMEPAQIIPFSLNGNAPSAKPFCKSLDGMFEPTIAERAAFVSALTKAIQPTIANASLTVAEALVSPAHRILSNFGATVRTAQIEHWLQREIEDPGEQEEMDPISALTTDIEMAYGRKEPTIGYVIGQMWRKLQNELRDQFNPNAVPLENAIPLINFDEGLKRYSYGPPVFAAEQLLTLIRQNIVSLNIVDDPDVELVSNGWQLRSGEKAVTAKVMIDAVIPNPDISKVSEPLISSLAQANIITPFSQGYGAKTSADGQLIGTSGDTIGGITMLGRLTLGSAIAVDSLTDCFGAQASRWASGVLQRHS